MFFKKKIRVQDSEIKGDVIAGDKHGLDEVQTRDLLQEVLMDNNIHKDHDLTVEDINRISNDLLQTFSPQSLINIYQNIDDDIKRKITSIDWANRRLINRNYEQPRREFSMIKFSELLTVDGNKHLIIGPGGLGKTFSLWHLAKELLNSGEGIPIYIPLSDFSSLSDLLSFFNSIVPNTDMIEQFKKVSDVVFFLDGWSQFPNKFTSTSESEKQKLLAILGNVRVIATSRFTTPKDEMFSIWELEGLTDSEIHSVLTPKNQDIRKLSNKLKGLLRYPLLLIIYVLLPSDSKSKGEILSEFQRNLTFGDPFQSALILRVMSSAIAKVSLIHNSRRKVDFEREMYLTAGSLNANDIPIKINLLGTLGSHENEIRPFHDLYFEWLQGIGIINLWDDLSVLAAKSFSTREGIILALESGELLNASKLNSIKDIDLVYTSSLVPYITIISREDRALINDLILKIESMLDSNIESDRYRGIIAALLSRKRSLFSKCLVTLEKNPYIAYYYRDFEMYIDNNFLFENKDILEEWVQKNSSINKEYFISVIKRSGDVRWLDWIEKQYINNHLSIGQAVGTILAIDIGLPKWIVPELVKLIEDGGTYHLREAAQRGMNLELARWIEQNYARFVKKGNSTFYNLNMILVRCGDDALFQEMFDRFDTFPPSVQELLLYAFKDRDQNWIAKFQEKYLYLGNTEIFHLVFENVFDTINDSIAEEWIQNQNLTVQTHGWRTLVNKYQNEVVPRLLANLPDSFNNKNYIPSLIAMIDLIDPAPHLIDEIFKRFRGKIQPKLLQDMLYVLAKIYPTGIPSIVNFIKDSPDLLPNYHLNLFLKLLKDWSTRSGIGFMISNGNTEMKLEEFLLLRQISSRNLDSFISMSLQQIKSEKVIDEIVTDIVAGDTELYNFLINSGGLPKYNSTLVKFILDSSSLAKVDNLFSLFSGCWHTFPESDLILILKEIAESSNMQENLSKFLYQLSKLPLETNIKFLIEILKFVFVNTEKYEFFRYIAAILAELSNESAMEILNPFLQENQTKTLLLIRLIEELIGKKLLDENKEWI